MWVWPKLHLWGRFLLTFILADHLPPASPPSISSLQHGVAHRTVQCLGSNFHHWQLELKSWPRLKGKVIAVVYTCPQRNFVHIICTHANTVPTTRIWKPGLHIVPDCSLKRWSRRASATQDSITFVRLCGSLAWSPLMLYLILSKSASLFFSLEWPCCSRFHHNKIFWQCPPERSAVL